MIGYVIYVALVVIFLFGLTIFAHELGHFIAARLTGMVVEVFSIGFGPPLWRRKIGGICYKIGILPIGGYVALPQMDPSVGSPEKADGIFAGSSDDSTGDQAKQEEEEKKPPLPPVSPLRRIIVSLAGGFGNIVLAFLLAWIVYTVGKPSTPAERSAVIGFVYTNSVAYAEGLRIGDEIIKVNGLPVSNWNEVLQENAMSDTTLLDLLTPAGRREVTLPTERSLLGFRMVPGLRELSLCRVMAVEPDSSAEKAGVRAGDLIVEFNGEKILSIEHLITVVAGRPDQPTAMIVERADRQVALNVTPLLDPAIDRARIGIRFDPAAVEYDKVVHIPPMTQIRGHTTGIFRVLRKLVTPREARATSEGLGGPLMIIYMFQDMVRKGIVVALWFTCFINVNLAILNLMPLPVLDGGHVVFALFEWVRGKPVPQRMIGWLSQLFFGLLIAALLLLSWRDVQRVFLLRGIFRPAAEQTADDSEGTDPADATP